MISFLFLSLLTCGASLLQTSAACEFNSAYLWTDWVTAKEDISYWDNRKQLAEEKRNPIDNPHPYAAETRFNANQMILNAPQNWSFVIIDIGNFNLCPKGCSPTLFGLMPLKNCSVELTSYDVYNPYVESILECLYSDVLDPTSECNFQYDQLNPNGVTILYNYGYNETWQEDVFYGEGGGITSSGSYLFVQETIGPDFVAPLELFYDEDGNLETTYDTPIIYKQVANTTDVLI